MSVSLVRNLGISAHIDAGKTTLTERILYYTRRIHAMHEVHGRDGVGAKMDSMELERERGITIQSAATHCRWKGHHVNIIDTPGHVDFTIEVERALRVLDGAVLVLCAVAGVQSQSITVDRQMRRYGVPRVAFINKCDRPGADADRVVVQLRERLGINPVLLQMPVAKDGVFDALVDLVTLELVHFEGPYGDDVVRVAVPEELAAEAERRREIMLDAVSMFSDTLTEAIIENRVSAQVIRNAIREATLERRIVPVLLGSAYRNRGVQTLLDAVVDYLPCPADVSNTAHDLDQDGAEVQMPLDPDGPLLALAFKLEDGRFGQLTYLRLYSGRLRRGESFVRVSTGRSLKVGRLVRMHAAEMEDIEVAEAGDIVALFGLDCSSGESFTDGTRRLALSNMHVPEPVISLGVSAKDNAGQIKLAKALQRFAKEDPTFRTGADPETGETTIRGMGELQLDVYLERIRREYGVDITASAPRVAYREAVMRTVTFDTTHKKQTGGAGQYARICGRIEPLEGRDFEFVDEGVGGSGPREYIPSVERGFRDMLEKGMLVGAPVRGIRVVLDDGAFHPVDSSDMAFQVAAHHAFREVYPRSQPRVLEPVMRVVVEAPSEFHGGLLGTLVQRRGCVTGFTELGADLMRLEADVPLAEMFGYSSTLRSASQGRAEFSMELRRYQPVPLEVQEALVKAWQRATARASQA